MITINLGKAKIIAHNYRRQVRERELAPLDEKIVKQIPGQSFAEIDAQRQVIRDKYAVFQTQIDSANTVDELHVFVQTMLDQTK